MIVCSPCAWCYTALAIQGLTSLTESGFRARNTCGFFVSACFVGWLCEYKTRKGNSTGLAFGSCQPPDNFDQNRKGTQMSTTIPLTYRVDYEIGLKCKELTPVSIEEISAQQSIFYCRCLFYLIRQAAISEPHDPLFNHLMFLHVLEQITTIGEALSDAAYNHVERLASLKTSDDHAKRKRKKHS